MNEPSLAQSSLRACDPQRVQGIGREPIAVRAVTVVRADDVEANAVA